MGQYKCSYNISLRLVESCEAYIGYLSPADRKGEFETVRFVMFMKTRPNSPTHLITVLLSLPPTREMLLTFSMSS